jgi:type IV pilus assembly protein PilY1
MKTHLQHSRRLLAFALSASLAFPAPLYAAATDIADGPLAQPASSVKPNMLLILDDSGSMARQFTPDYVSSNSNAGTVANCFGTRDSNSPPTATPQDCFAGDPPAMSPDFNTQYYNPEIRYYPAVTYDGTSKGEMDAAATSNWTAVKTDNVSSATENAARKLLHTGDNSLWPAGDLGSTTARNTHWDSDTPSTPVTTINLVTNFPDRVWCNSTGASATNTSVCKTNSSYSYPNDVFGFGKDGSGDRKYKFGPPYYYRLNATEFCTNATLTVCVAGTTPTTVSGVDYNVPAKVRFCDSTAHTNCQAKRTDTFKFPKFLGTVNPAAPASAGVRARGTISVIDAQDSSLPIILQIRLTLPAALGGGTVNLIASTIIASAAPTDANGRNTVADQIVNAINAQTGVHGYTAARTTNANTSGGPAIVTVTAPAIGVDHNGTTIFVDAPAGTPTVPARETFQVDDTDNNNYVNQITVGTGGSAVALLSATITCTAGAGCSGNQGQRDNWMAGAIRDAINAGTGTHGYTSTSSSDNVTIIAPAGTGPERNGFNVSVSEQYLDIYGLSSLSGGSAPNDLEHTVSNFSAGADASAAMSWARQNVGDFVRTDIVLGQTYPKYPARTDCTGTTTCTYAEEITNFANWFAYYRTRLQMSKTSIGRAFLTLGSDFRVGFKTINFSSTHYLAVDDFATTSGGQKDNWFTKLYNAPASGGTPNRAALARAGRYYGNQNPDSMGASPILLACQPSYSVLVTDGYWNDTSGYKQLDGTTNVGNQDSGGGSPPAEVQPYATLESGSWDGLAASNTLADVAMYYYKTDLRSDLSNQVPNSGDDDAPHQHMTTFTVGMGLAGTLNYDPNYKTQTSGDFFNIKQGDPFFWPVPTSSAETTLDDLWHAAVNGRGKFFSAQDPVALANGIAETLNAVQARVGAGAAAATSNLQPVAGDNFAFTAQYQTVEWSGDIKARTIDLSTGAVSTRELWSAQSLLDQRAHDTRRIFTFDAADTTGGSITLPSGASRAQNSNKLRSFCWTTATTEAAGTNCGDGGMLTTGEMDAHFDPMGGPNGQLLQSVPWPTDGSNRHVAATKSSLVDYLRGEVTNENSGGTAASDLYRNRSHLLGDIVNAQPAYVKAPPFSYSDGTNPFYSTFKTNNILRLGRVYAAANDGMLHAFATDPDNIPYFQDAGIGTSDDSTDDTFTGTLDLDPVSGEGSENWAYVPSLVFPTLKRLAENTYGTNHRFSVDGSPVVADVCFGHTTATPCAAATDWKTVLVGGLNAGGRGFYALDITDPQNPKGLWELKGGTGAACIANDAAVDGTQTEDCNLGLSFGNPLVVKRPSDGKWVVIVTSGHNNISPGDGLGHLYVVDVATGKILQRISTPAGDATNPSGLSRINGWVNDSTLDNTVRTIYGGDLLGNLWRFQMETVVNGAGTADDVAAGSLTLLATLEDPSGTPQPISTRPELGDVNGQRVIYLATGKFLGLTDKFTEQRHTVYAIRDDLNLQRVTPAVYDMARTAGNLIPGFVRQDLVTSDIERTVTTPQAVSFTTNFGWFVDLPDGGSTGSPSERVNVDPVLQLGTLVVPSNVPSTETCVAGGYGWVNFFDYRSGAYVQGSDFVSTKVSGSLVVGINVIQLPGGVVKTIVTTADNQQLTKETPVSPSNIQGRRVTWRELLVE